MRFADYSRSDVPETATAAREEPAADLHLTSAQACRAGSCADICNVLISLCDCALYADAALKHNLLSVMIGQLVEKTALAEHLRKAALFCRGEPKSALLQAHAMFDAEDWKRLLLDKHFEY